jgi:hypothetical protein
MKTTTMKRRAITRSPALTDQAKTWRKGKTKWVACSELTTIFNCKATWKYRGKKRRGAVTVTKP